jgi:hypothetical protein
MHIVRQHLPRFDPIEILVMAGGALIFVAFAFAM